MKVTIENDYAGGGAARGGTHYLRHLLANVARVAPENEYESFAFFFKDYAKKAAQIKSPSGVSSRILRWPQSLVYRAEWSRGLPVIEAALRGTDVYHCVRVPKYMGERCAVVQADITPVTHPQWHTKESQAVWERITLPGLWMAKRIITFSEASKRDMVRELGLPAEKIRITRLGVDHEVFKPRPKEWSRDYTRMAYGLPDKFFLMVGPLDPVCDFAAVVKAVKLLGKDAPKIVVVTSRDNYAIKQVLFARDEGVGDNFIWPGYIPHHDLAAVYNLATALIHPSKLPGWELPPLEAMACGTPVITTLEENVGRTGWLLSSSASDPENIVKGFRLDEAKLRRMSEGGLALAVEYTWECTARETLKVWREVAD